MDSITINVKDYGNFKFSSGGTIEDLVKIISPKENIIAAIVKNEIVELNYELKEDVSLSFVNTMERLGAKIYRNGLKLLYICAVKEIYGDSCDVRVLHSLDKGIYTTISEKITKTTLTKIKSKMKELSDKDFVINKVTTSRKEAIEYFESINEKEKAESLKLMTGDVVTLYSLLDYYNYFYSLMPVSTKVLNKFDLTLVNDGGIMLQYPSTYDGKVPKYTHIENTLMVFKNYRKWINKLNISFISDLNKIVISGKIKEFIELNELKHGHDLDEISDNIVKNKDKIKVILISGPSSSGKTTTSKKLSLRLKARGINPFIISTDDYFKERLETPKNEKGDYEYDIIEALDIELFNDHISRLLNGETILMPKYNFITGEKEYKNKPISLKGRDVLIIEGIHTLNDELTKSIDKKMKYKIYISPFTPLGLDRHNHISTVDLRLIRRLVRDYRTRGYSAEETLKNWQIVRVSEEKYIYPYAMSADITLNTALIYELGVLKTYAMPILLSIDSNSEFYPEALRIMKFLKYFIGIPAEDVPSTALLREFIGGGYFE